MFGKKGKHNDAAAVVSRAKYVAMMLAKRCEE